MPRSPIVTARAAAVLATAPLLLLLAVPVEASCAPAEASVAPASAGPGQSVTVRSSTWFGICNDTGQDVDVTDRAVVTFVQGDRRVELGRTNSNAEGVFALTVRVPAAAVPGPAVLEVRGRQAADDVALTVAAGRLPRTGHPGAGPVSALAVLTAGAGLLLRRRVRHGRSA